MSARPRRFYSRVAVAVDGDAFVVRLDDRPLRSPAGRILRLLTRPLADAVADEWDAQGAQIDAGTMPVFGIAGTAIDRIGPQRAAVIERLLAYVETDLVCYRASEPADLAARQEAMWRPLLAWAAETWGLRLVTTDGILPVRQPPDGRQELRAAIDALDDVALAALALAVPLAGSLLIGAALVFGHLSADDAHAAACLDEIYQATRWGTVDAAEQRRQSLLAELRAAERAVRLSRPLSAMPATVAGRWARP